MPPRAHDYSDENDYRFYDIPDGAHRDGSVEIAIRVWHSSWSATAGGGPASGGGLAGDSSLLAFRRTQDQLALRWISTSHHIVILLELLAAFGSLGLYLYGSREREYLWFSIMLSMNALVDSTYLVWSYVSLPVHARDVLGYCALGAENLASLAFFQTLLNAKRGRNFYAAVVCIALSVFIMPARVANPHVFTGMVTSLLQGLLFLPLYIWVLHAFYKAARKGARDARILGLPTFLLLSVQLMFSINEVTYRRGWQKSTNFDIHLTNTPFPLNLDQAAQVAFLLAVFAVLLSRFTRTRGLEERLAAEVEGARVVQQFLIPEDLPKTQGFQFESEYRPAREVGGDFFQVVPHAMNGSVLIVIGDVAGKGMQAGMLATLLVGAVRTATSFTQDPALLMATLNGRLYGKGNATCLALHVCASGVASLVNAGHLPPYLNGHELPIEGALPLGTIPENEFPVLNFQLGPGDRLTMITDGILEAQTAKGELFGFERILQHLAGHTSASSLAEAAQAFGQEDDITVLTVFREH